MKRLSSLAFAVLLAAAPAAMADEGPAPLHFREDVSNLASVQRGARDFMNYCSGCHSLKYLRYNRMAGDLGIPEDVLKSNLMFTSEKVGDPIISAMPAAAKDWFGQQPPDLTLEAKARGSDWIYSYLLGFYLDDKRPLGVNNVYLPNVAMPHVLGDLQGWQTLPQGEGKEAGEEGPKFDLAVPGKLSPEEYKAFVGDLANFLAYAGEPGKSQRIAIGFKVMLYLFVLLILTYLLKKEFWRDVH